MSKLRVQSFGVSLDGFAAGPDQSLEHPAGQARPGDHDWVFPTRMFRQMQGQQGGETGIDNDMMLSGFDGVGAWILGRNMFGPVRGPWPGRQLEGLVGRGTAVPLARVRAHAPCARAVAMKGGTTFHFVTDGIESALAQAREAAGGA
jgi:dihydrofolate reductase